ncbi:MAG: hypothetical protein JW722_03985 [Demequinaceae bacterium]|nr:hypothetical protein [Demequinaceae bacterium]
MKAIVVYQSLWGSTAAVAQAIAEGLGKGAKALSTTEATPEALRGVDLVVAGAPIHAFNLPTKESVESSLDRAVKKGDPSPDVSQMLMRDWLGGLPGGIGAAAAAFDTRVPGPLGHGGASKILKRMDRAGLTPVAKPRGFQVAMRTTESIKTGELLDGELDRAREWGRELAAAVA